MGFLVLIIYYFQTLLLGLQTSRTTTVMAVRDTELAQMPQGLLDAIKQMYPQVSHSIHQSSFTNYFRYCMKSGTISLTLPKLK